MAVRLEAGSGVAIVDVEHGGRLASLTIDGVERLVTEPDAEGSISWGCYLMAPWPGRLADGRFEWRGRTVQRPLTAAGSAIHGLVHGVTWAVVAAGPASVELEVGLGPLGWPFGGHVRQLIELRADGVHLEAAIRADEPMPAALGWHPWFHRGPDDLRLRLTAAGTLDTVATIPTGDVKPIVPGGAADLRDGPLLGERRLDDTFVGVDSPVVVGWPDLDLEVGLIAGRPNAVVFTPARGCCVEPMSAWPNALATRYDDPGGNITELAAGEELRASTTWTWRRAARSERA